MFNIFKKVFGTKYDRDVKEYSPVVDQINSYFESYSSLSNDELRQKTVEFRARIADHLAGIDKDISQIEQAARDEEDLNQKEVYFNQIDDLKKDRDEHLEAILKQILPEAFAVVKETARRFSQGEPVVATATDHDLDPAILALKGDPEYGEYLSSDCTTCHQASGGDDGIPSIVLWPEEDFVIAMHAYKNKDRPNPVMQMMAGRLNDEEIAALAAYFATLEE